MEDITGQGVGDLPSRSDSNKDNNSNKTSTIPTRVCPIKLAHHPTRPPGLPRKRSAAARRRETRGAKGKGEPTRNKVWARNRGSGVQPDEPASLLLSCVGNGRLPDRDPVLYDRCGY